MLNFPSSALVVALAGWVASAPSASAAQTGPADAGAPTATAPPAASVSAPAAERSLAPVDQGEQPPAASAGRAISLSEAQKMAAANNLAFQNISELVYQADTLIQSAWAMLLPNLSASGSITLHDKEISFPMMMPGATQPSNLVIQDLWGQGFGFSANMALFNPRSIPGIQIAYELADQTRLQARIDRDNLLFAVTSVYYQANAMREMISAAEENLATAQHFSRLSEARVRVGQSSKIDVLRARLRVMDAEKELANARDGYQQARIALGRLAGIKGEFVVVEPEPAAPIDRDAGELADRALGNRLELKVAALDRKIAERGETEAWMQWLPAFDATYAWNWTSAGGLGDSNDSWMLIFGAKWDLFKGGSRIAEINTRKSRIRMAANSREQIELNIREEVEQGYLVVKQQRRNLDLAGEQVALAEQNDHLVTRQYEVGMASSLDLVTAAAELSSKRIAMVLDSLKYDMAVLTLKRSVGEYHALASVPR